MFKPGRRYDSTRQAWEEIWNSASVEKDLATVSYARAQETLNAYLPYLPKDAPILEAGSGLSAILITLRRLGYPAIGLHYAVNALHTSHQYDPTLPLMGGDVPALPFAENSLGGYLSFGVLEHFEHGMGPALREAYRVLRPGGVLVLTIPYPNVVHQLVEWRRKSRGGSLLTNDEFYESAYDRPTLCQAVEAVGFKLELVQPTSHSFTLWGLGGPFQAPGFYQTSALAEGVGKLLQTLLPWPFNYMTLVVGRKVDSR